MYRLLIIVAFAWSGLVTSVLSQPPHQASTMTLANKDVLQMLSEGLGPEIVVAKIKSSPCNFDTSPAAVKGLKSAGVPDSVILAMVEAGSSSDGSYSEDGKPRVYISDSQSWLIAGGFGESNGTGGGAVRGGSSPQTVEVIKTFQQRCPEVVITNEKQKAAYAILFDRESFKGVLRNRYKIAVFKRNGDSIFSDSTKSVGNAVKDACQAILKDFGAPASTPK